MSHSVGNWARLEWLALLRLNVLFQACQISFCYTTSSYLVARFRSLTACNNRIFCTMFSLFVQAQFWIKSIKIRIKREITKHVPDGVVCVEGCSKHLQALSAGEVTSNIVGGTQPKASNRKCAFNGVMETSCDRIHLEFDVICSLVRALLMYT